MNRRKCKFKKNPASKTCCYSTIYVFGEKRNKKRVSSIMFRECAVVICRLVGRRRMKDGTCPASQKNRETLLKEYEEFSDHRRDKKRSRYVP
jgi:hypothetical protein